MNDGFDVRDATAGAQRRGVRFTETGAAGQLNGFVEGVRQTRVRWDSENGKLQTMQETVLVKSGTVLDPQAAESWTDLVKFEAWDD